MNKIGEPFAFGLVGADAAAAAAWSSSSASLLLLHDDNGRSNERRTKGSTKDGHCAMTRKKRNKTRHLFIYLFHLF